MLMKRLSTRFSPIPLIAVYLFFLAALPLLSTETAQAETRYIIPSSEIAIRTGQGTEYKIIAVVKDGTSVELLEEDDSYAKVRLPDGKEGWIIKRFLSEEAPLQQLVATLQEANDALKAREIETVNNLETISSRLEQTETERNTILAERDQLASDYTKLKQDTSDVALIKKDSLRISQENKTLTENLASLRADYEALKKDRAINWFLAGGGVLLLGILVGRISAASRKRRPSLL